MQNNIFTTIRSLKIMDGCKGIQVFAINPSGTTTITNNGGNDGGVGVWWDWVAGVVVGLHGGGGWLGFVGI
ncbi:unnamed protein product, partial [Prunus brigantina]